MNYGFFCSWSCPSSDWKMHFFAQMPLQPHPSLVSMPTKPTSAGSPFRQLLFFPSSLLSFSQNLSRLPPTWPISWISPSDFQRKMKTPISFQNYSLLTPLGKIFPMARLSICFLIYLFHQTPFRFLWTWDENECSSDVKYFAWEGWSMKQNRAI